jgi:hypothetical protein
MAVLEPPGFAGELPPPWREKSLPRVLSKEETGRFLSALVKPSTARSVMLLREVFQPKGWLFPGTREGRHPTSRSVQRTWAVGAWCGGAWPRSARA